LNKTKLLHLAESCKKLLQITLSLLVLLLLLLHFLGNAWAMPLLGPLCSALLIVTSLGWLLDPQESQNWKARALYLLILFMALFSLCLQLPA